MILRFTIPLPPVTKKNSSQIVKTKTGRPFIIPSKTYREYEAVAMPHMFKLVDEPISEPCEVTCFFYMPTKRKCDLTNLLEAIDDLMVKAGILEDDNYTIIFSHDGSRVFYDKDNPRTEVVIETVEHT